ncbi:hypothetical protein CY652_04140 [Burkholderia sp. WAC0059]|uniref:hypothetical protein n=1 Tax=Burkholderia sp. WAC0059 TaxID=2066022 RepID=UPI000C7EB14F|nr:hypothetical protein [Burkholderia sp. WAC0059]PLZ03587.1 hypothetical protein CY652_04140 [Burkholderia sp. WAC0059]
MPSRLTGKYFVNGLETPEKDAASRWFDYAQAQGIDVSRAISLWEDAALPDGDQGRAAVGQAGIRIELPDP